MKILNYETGAIGKDVLSHRIISRLRISAEKLTNEDLIQKILDYIPIPG